MEPEKNEVLEETKTSEKSANAQNFPAAAWGKKLITNKKLLFSLLVGIALVGAILAIVFGILLAPKPINLTDYYDVQFSGMSGKGEAVLVFDSTSFMEDMEEQYPKASSAAKVVYGRISLLGAEAEGENDGKTLTGLKNGDVILLETAYSKSFAEKNKIKFVTGEKKITVEGLTEPTTLDLFEDVEVVFTGISPNVKAEIKNNSKNEFVQRVEFSLDKTENLKNDEVITLSAKYSAEEAKSNYYIIDQNIKKYTVSGMPHYIESIDEIPAELRTEIQNRADKVATDSFLSGINQTSGAPIEIQGTLYDLNEIGSITNLKIDKIFFWSTNATDSSYQNGLYVLYSFSINGVPSGFRKVDYPTAYGYVFFGDFVSSADGTVELEEQNILCGKRVYKDWEKCNNSLISTLEETGTFKEVQF